MSLLPVHRGIRRKGIGVEKDAASAEKTNRIRI